MNRIRKALITLTITMILSVPILAVPIAGGGDDTNGDCQDIICV